MRKTGFRIIGCLFLATFSVASSFVLAQQINQNEQWVIEPKYDEVIILDNSRYKVRKDGKYGFMADNNKVLAPLTYDTMMSFNDGLMAVVKDGKLGYMDVNGKVIIAPQYQFDKSYLNIDSVVKYQPYNFIHGLSIVKVNDVLKAIDKSGGLIFGDSLHLEARALDKLIISHKGKFGIWSQIGGLFIKPDKYDNITDMRYGELFAFKENDKWGFINIDGQITYPAMFDTLSVYSSEQGTYIKGKRNSKTALISTDGKVVLQPFYDDVFVSNGFLLTKDSNMYGLADFNETGYLHTEFDTVRIFTKPDTLFVGILKGYNFVFDKKGKKLLVGENDILDFMPDNTLLLEFEGRYFKQNLSGIITEYQDYKPKQEEEETFITTQSTLSYPKVARKDEKYGVIDIKKK